MPQQDKAAIAVAAFEAMGEGIATGDFSRLEQYLADDVEITFFGSTKAAGTFAGKDRVLRWFRGASKFFNGGLSFNVRHVIAGETAVAIEWSDSGTAFGGQPYDNFGVSVYEIRDRKVTAYREYIDTERVKALFATG